MPAAALDDERRSEWRGVRAARLEVWIVLRSHREHHAMLAVGGRPPRLERDERPRVAPLVPRAHDDRRMARRL